MQNSVKGPSPRNTSKDSLKQIETNQLYRKTQFNPLSLTSLEALNQFQTISKKLNATNGFSVLGRNTSLDPQIHVKVVSTYDAPPPGQMISIQQKSGTIMQQKQIPNHVKKSIKESQMQGSFNSSTNFISYEERSNERVPRKVQKTNLSSHSNHNYFYPQQQVQVADINLNVVKNNKSRQDNNSITSLNQYKTQQSQGSGNNHENAKFGKKNIKILDSLTQF